MRFLQYAQRINYLLHKKLCIRILDMSKYKEWFSAAAGRRVTVVEIAKHLDVNRNTATSRMQEGLSSDEIITLARKLHINPVTALEELDKLTLEEVLGYFEQGGKLIETADNGELALELARRLNPVSKLADFDGLAARRRSSAPTPVSDVDDSLHDDEDDGTVHEWDDTVAYAADSSPEENEERLKRGEDPVD